MQKFYVYRFKNAENEIIYVGKTKNLEQRIRTHFGKQGHLPEECYKEVRKVEFLTFEKESLMGIKELYYIAKFQPRYNTADKSDYLFFSALEEGDNWEDCLYAENFINKTLTKMESELKEENEKLKRQLISLRQSITDEYLKKIERLEENLNFINEVKNSYADECVLYQRIVSAYERNTDFIWCERRNKLVRNYTK